ncbi:MAG: hypothetical protein SVP26_09455 [Chloroflexota bacterium]|nr:hypothetical protein [Chloroflexota bacterium]
MNSEALREKMPTWLGGASRSKGNGACSDFDLLYQLSYMSVIASAGVPRKRVFMNSAELDCSSSQYFRRVERTSTKLGYDYAKSCRVVGENIDQEEIRGLLLRFSSALVSGEPEGEFLAGEAEAHANAYVNDYGRKLEGLRKWSDAYVSLILSSVLVVIVGLVSTMIWKIGLGFILGLVGICIGTTSVGVWLIYLMSPQEATVVNWAGSSRRNRVQKVLKVLVPVAAVVGIGLLVSGANPGWILIIASALVMPVGFIAMSADKKVTKKDMEVGPFLRSLGGVSSAIGTTIKDAIGRLDLNAINYLRPEVKRLSARLVSGLSAKMCWQRFVDETGSELAKRSMTMFYDAVELGGEPEQAGYHASLFASKIAMLRAQRKTLTSPFRWLCITMHAAIVVLLVFVTEVITIFGSMIAMAQQSMPDLSGGQAGANAAAFNTFNFAGLEFMHGMVLPLVLVFTVANALAATIADGGSRWKLLYDLGITGAISGACLVFLPPVAASVFSSIQM